MAAPASPAAPTAAVTATAASAAPAAAAPAAVALLAAALQRHLVLWELRGQTMTVSAWRISLTEYGKCDVARS